MALDILVYIGVLDGLCGVIYLYVGFSLAATCNNAAC